MKILYYEINSLHQAGVLSIDGESVYSFKQLGLPWNTIQELCDDKDTNKLKKIKNRLKEISKEGTSLRDVKILSPIPEVRRGIICIGFNFQKHAQEVAVLRGESKDSANVSYPIYFSKRNATTTGPGDAIPYVKGYAENLDVGIEVGVIVGQDALNVPKEKVKEYILGYTIANDVCDTRINKVYTQPFLGKSIDGYIPIGPWIVTTDEFEENPLFDLKLTVNGEIRQKGNTRDLVFDIPYIVSELSTNMTLKAGTIIATGSPANIDAGNLEKLLLLPGDIITCEISQIGTLTNVVKEKNDAEVWL